MSALKEKQNRLTIFQILQYVFIYGLLIITAIFGALCIVYSRLLEGSIICISSIITFFMMLYMMRLDYKANTIKFRQGAGTPMFTILDMEHWFKNDDKSKADIIFGTKGICIKESELIDGQDVMLYSNLADCSYEDQVLNLKFNDNSNLHIKFVDVNKGNAVISYIFKKFLKKSWYMLLNVLL